MHLLWKNLFEHFVLSRTLLCELWRTSQLQDLIQQRYQIVLLAYKNSSSLRWSKQSRSNVNKWRILNKEFIEIMILIDDAVKKTKNPLWKKNKEKTLATIHSQLKKICSWYVYRIFLNASYNESLRLK